MGTSQDTVTQNLILELFTQRGARLDQLGLQYDQIRQRAEELQDADAQLTDQMAYQQAVLEQANERFGALATSSAGAATGVENLHTAWTDLRSGHRPDVKGPLDDMAQALADVIDQTTEAIEKLRELQREQQVGTVPGGLGIETNRAGTQQILDDLLEGRARVLGDIATNARPPEVTGPLLAELDDKIEAASISLAGFDAAINSGKDAFQSGISDWCVACPARWRMPAADR